MSMFSWSLAQSHDADLRPGDLFEIRDTETGQVVYRRLIDDSDVERGQFNVPAGVLEDGVMYGHRVKRRADGGEWSASSVFSLARPPEKSATPVTPMTLTDFLLARIAEDEADARGDDGSPTPIGMWDPARVLAECEAKRRIVEWHANWPVLAETQPEIETVGSDPASMTFRMTKQVAWLTEQEYRTRFGAESPSGPILRMLALPYADHPDYREEWRP